MTAGGGGGRGKTCLSCGVTKLLDEFFGDNHNVDRHRNVCKPCDLEANRLWTLRNQDRRREYERARWHRRRGGIDQRPTKVKWRNRNPAVTRLVDGAGRAVRRALRDGALVRPATCEWCGATGKRIYAAHRDYGRPLEVTWLCNSCHTRWDKSQPKAVECGDKTRSSNQ